MSHSYQNRNRRPVRGQSKRPPKVRILILTEGEVTEREYFNAFQKEFRNALVELQISDSQGVPLTLVRKAVEQKNSAADKARRNRDDFLRYDSVWCIFDVDEHPNFGSALEMARDNNVDLAVSNPNFELWLLLHFQDQSGTIDRSNLPGLIRHYCPQYSSKNKHVEFALFKAGYPEAFRRAEQLDSFAARLGEPNRNPTTGVYRLTQLIESGVLEESTPTTVSDTELPHAKNQASRTRDNKR